MHPAGLRCSSLTYARYARSSRLAGRAPRRPEWRTYFRTGPKPAMCADCRPLEFPLLAVRIGARYTPKPSPAANLVVARFFSVRDRQLGPRADCTDWSPAAPRHSPIDTITIWKRKQKEADVREKRQTPLMLVVGLMLVASVACSTQAPAPPATETVAAAEPAADPNAPS